MIFYKYPPRKAEVPEDSRWKQIPDFPTYWISNHGQVFNMHRGTLLNPYYNNHRVKCVGLYRNRRVLGRSLPKLMSIYWRETDG
jgi:hypothetical protein